MCCYDLGHFRQSSNRPESSFFETVFLPAHPRYSLYGRTSHVNGTAKDGNDDDDDDDEKKRKERKKVGTTIKFPFVNSIVFYR